MEEKKADGIIAVATATGRAGIGVIRLSGSRELTGFMLEKMTGILNPSPRHAYFTAMKNSRGEVIDRGVVIWFSAPHSYTGEDVIEFQTHGNPVIQDVLLREALEAGKPLGLRLAEPGEFTRRAFESGQIDLAQAESVMDLINASSEDAVRAAQKSLSGDFSNVCRELEEKLIALRTNVEAILDFPEEEIDFIKEGRIKERIAGLRAVLETLLRQAGQGNLLREGAVIALVGSPNVGKSSLLNRLSERDVAIVTDIPGTTRDLVENVIQINGLQLRLVDTAGIRETSDVIEAAGIRRALSEVEKSDLILHLVSAETPASDEELSKIEKHVRPGTRVITVVNKIDLLGEPHVPAEGEICISAKRGDGVDELKREILKTVGYNNSVQGVFLARKRHVEALKKALQSLGAAAELLESPENYLDMVAEELRLAAESFGEILGEFSSDDLLGRIFSTFCIGK